MEGEEARRIFQRCSNKIELQNTLLRTRRLNHPPPTAIWERFSDVLPSCQRFGHIFTILMAEAENIVKHVASQYWLINRPPHVTRRRPDPQVAPKGPEKMVDLPPPAPGGVCPKTKNQGKSAATPATKITVLSRRPSRDNSVNELARVLSWEIRSGKQALYRNDTGGCGLIPVEKPRGPPPPYPAPKRRPCPTTEAEKPPRKKHGHTPPCGRPQRPPLWQPPAASRRPKRGSPKLASSRPGSWRSPPKNELPEPRPPLTGARLK